MTVAPLSLGGEASAADIFRLRRVFDGIYMLTFPTQYDVSMHFVRAQEFYECPDDRFRGKPFRLIDFMRWYAVEREGAKGYFNYVTEWEGYNIPKHVFHKLFEQHGIPDENAYDRTMRAVYDTLNGLVGEGEPWYLVGCTEGSGCLEHEVAHGLWYVRPEYRSEVLGHIERMEVEHPSAHRAVRAALLAEGYTHEVLDDELQAYLSTGVAGRIVSYLGHEEYEDDRLEALRAPFVNTFERFLDDPSNQLPWRTRQQSRR